MVVGNELPRGIGINLSLEQANLRVSLESTAERIVEEFVNIQKTNGVRGLNLCAPLSFKDYETAKIFVEIVSSGKYPLSIAERSINPMFEYVGEDRRNVTVGYSVPLRYVKPQNGNGKNGNGGGSGVVLA